MIDYSTHHVSQSLVNEIVHALQSVNQYGSIEIYIQNGMVTQITVRNIKKTQVSLNQQQGQKKVRGSIAVISHIQT